MKYIVEIKEVHNASYEVEASSPQEALIKAEEISSDELGDLQYSHTLGPDEWMVYEVKGASIRPTIKGVSCD